MILWILLGIYALGLVVFLGAIIRECVKRQARFTFLHLLVPLIWPAWGIWYLWLIFNDWRNKK